MEGGNKSGGLHVLAVPYPAQGHINPFLQFSKRLASKGLKVTIANTVFIANSLHLQSATPSGSVHLETISDGYDEGGFATAESIAAYLSRMEAVGSKTLAQLIAKHKASPNPIDCVIYDPFMPWALEVTKQLGLFGAAFLTQACTVKFTFYLQRHGLPITSTTPGLHVLDLPQDLPSFFTVPGSYPAYFEMVLNQFSNTHKADFIFANTFYDLEPEAVDSMSKVCPLLTIGPTIPSAYLDNRIEDDKDYGLHLFKTESVCTEWLSTKPAGSVVYVAFGSMASLSEKQMEELAFGLKQSGRNFLWVVRASEEAKLPHNLIEQITNQGNGIGNNKRLIVKWSPQLEVLSHEAVGCFFTHGGWNSTIEALSLGVPMIAMPQWTDQPTNSKLIADVWKVGVRVKVDELSGVVGRGEIECCIKRVMMEGNEMKENAKKWRKFAIEAVSEGGSSDNNVLEFVSKLAKRAGADD